MKLQIDTIAKTIKIEESINASELFQLLNEMFPDSKWKEYLVIPVEVIHEWINPITIPWPAQPWVDPWVPSVPYPVLPWWNPPYVITCGDTSKEVTHLYYAGNSDTPVAYGTNQSLYNVIVNKK
jgi:hypothetical protein